MLARQKHSLSVEEQDQPLPFALNQRCKGRYLLDGAEKTGAYKTRMALSRLRQRVELRVRDWRNQGKVGLALLPPR